MDKKIETTNVETSAAPKKRTSKNKAENVAPVAEVPAAEVPELVNPNQLNVLKLSLGWNESNPLRYPDKAPKGVEPKPILYAYRNRFFSDRKPQLDDLVDKGLMEYTECGINGVQHTGYKVTEAGIQWLSDHENIIVKIKPLRHGDDWRSKKPSAKSSK